MPESSGAAPAPNPSVKSIIERYIQHSEATGLHGGEALDERKRTLRRFAAWKFDLFTTVGELPVAACAPHLLEDFIESQAGWKSSSTRRDKAKMVKACFNWARRGKRILENPFEHVNYEEAEPRPVMPDATLDVFVEEANVHFERALLFLRKTGARLSTFFRLEWEHIDWERGVAIVPNHKSKKKTKKPLSLPLVEEAIEILRKVQAEDYHPGIIFRNTDGTPWNRRTLGQQLRRMKARLGVQSPATLHGIRHQVGTMAVRNGALLKFVSKGLGHSSQAVTEKHYVHVDPDLEAMRDAIRRSLAKPAAGGSATPQG